MTFVETSWVKDLVDELGASADHKYDSEPLLALLSSLSGDVTPGEPVEKLVEVGDPVPETDQALGDFAPSGGGM
ncbi:hypothetical protein SAMN04488527_1479 [Aliiroseovarius crassostreae]|uniref:Uncharacterized protein n=1 Tax=Aliiroseovarius crassostreae TaxID=154981 RepID=A0A0P7KHI2_9RHOB|nr:MULTISPECIES: hypothetical protein [Rhodobacterales]KPN62925.1 hypothetical protein AKJ29_01915 [Aliiroseovarius crassostreae]UTS82778.1 hypothetical protein OL67_003888 [Phaeobacter piscinae]SFU94493.1 hypothetical protein SAMN04488527_1479 [Aliiroseovarius crassostreae]